MPMKHAILIALMCITCVSAVDATIVGEEWSPVTGNASWSPRYDHTALVFNNELWVLGGSGGNDVWKSADGRTWSKVTDSAGWLPRIGHASVVFDNRMWVLGGGSGSLNNDVWYSTDGVTWTEATKNAGWSPRSGHASFVYEGKIWVLGGGSGSLNNDVWYSTDGVTWTEATKNAGWSPRLGHASFVYEGKIWVLGGGSESGVKNDVWYSTDGGSWTPVTETAEWTCRSGHQSAVFGGRMWVLGGYIGLRSRSGRQEVAANDIWYSYDGKIWYPATMEADWSPRYGHMAVVFHDRMWVLGGNEPGGPEGAIFDLGPGEYVYSRLPDIIDNDVWKSDSVIKSPTTTSVTSKPPTGKPTQSSSTPVIIVCSTLFLCIFLDYRKRNIR